MNSNCQALITKARGEPAEVRAEGSVFISQGCEPVSPDLNPTVMELWMTRHFRINITFGS